MRTLGLLLIFSAACATSPPRPTAPEAPAPPRGPPAPAAVAAATSATGALYIDATCATLEKASGRTNGFFAADDVFVTVYHAKEASRDLFPSFAVVTDHGCHDARHADQFPEFDVLFLRVSGREGGPSLRLSGSIPAAGDKAYAISSEWTERPTAKTAAKIRQGVRMGVRTLTVNPLPPKAAEYKRSPVWDASPALHKGDSGSAVVDEKGEVTGMLLALIGSKQGAGMDGTVFLSGWVIEKLLAHCAPCEIGE